MFEDILIKYEGGDLNYQNHDNDNSFYTCNTVTDFRKWCQKYDYLYEGITDKVGYERRDDLTDVALVFKSTNDELFWVHFTAMTLCSWIAHELESNYSHEEAFDKAIEISKDFFKKNNIKVKSHFLR